MHSETYTHILSYFQYICKLFDFKISQKKKKHFENVGNFQIVCFCIFLRLNIYLIAILYCCVFAIYT